MIELVEGLWVNPDDIKAVKHISANKCTVWIAGIEPLVVSCDAQEILSELGHFFPDDDEEEEDGDDDTE